MIDFTQEIQYFSQYKRLLEVMAQLSKLFSDNSVPFINYRVVENLFCRCFNAENLSRSDTAFDARFNKTGIGIKTFIINKQTSYEKIAEFNNLSSKLNTLNKSDLALSVSNYRNDRITLAKRLYGITNSQYHIVARQNSKLLLFETDYDTISIDEIDRIKQTDKSISFSDGKHSYRYSFSKSTLYREFVLPNNVHTIDINILDDPFSLLLKFQSDLKSHPHSIVSNQLQYVILPLYGQGRIIHPKSGLNQWNASGRKRDFGEMYIPIPREIHKLHPHFFPKRDKSFSLRIPTGEVFTAKVCQDNEKALMTNPNKSLSDWLLRYVLQLEEGELATIEKLDTLGFDSVIIIKSENDNEYLIDVRKTGSYENFLSNQAEKSL